MPKTLQDKIKELPPDRQQVIALRHDQLVADESARQGVRTKDLNNW